jgi:GH18 family chitinase
MGRFLVATGSSFWGIGGGVSGLRRIRETPFSLAVESSPGAEPHFRAEDNQNYTSFLKEPRIRFDRLEKELHWQLYLTVATCASQEFLSHTEMEKVQRHINTVNLLAHDYYEPDSDSITGHQASLKRTISLPVQPLDNTSRETSADKTDGVEVFSGLPCPTSAPTQ